MPCEVNLKIGLGKMGLVASKTKQINGPEYYRRFMLGKVLDIGCGPDLVINMPSRLTRNMGMQIIS